MNTSVLNGNAADYASAFPRQTATREVESVSAEQDREFDEFSRRRYLLMLRETRNYFARKAFERENQRTYEAENGLGRCLDLYA